MMKTLFKLSLMLTILLGVLSCERKDDPIPDKFVVAMSENVNVPGSEIKYATLDNEFKLKSSPAAALKSSKMQRVETEYFWIAETELTYGMWKEIYDWAKNNGYTFETIVGQTGSDEGFPKTHPVTRVSWLHSLAWTNALTEYYNMYNGDKPDYTLVYYHKGEPYRDARWENSESDAITYDKTATGFRIPTNAEWYSAASYGGTPDNYACGALADYENTSATNLVAWYRQNSDMVTHPVAQKLPNALGLYDMSGNASEIVFDKLGFDATHHNYRGGAYNSNPDRIAIGWHTPMDPHTNSRSLSFRIARKIGGDNHVEILSIDEESNTGGINSGEGSGTFTYNNKTYPIVNAILYNYNSIGSPLLELEMFSEGISPKVENNGGYTGIGSFMEISIFSSHSRLENNQSYTSDLNPGSIINALVNSNMDLFPWTYSESFLAGKDVNISIAISENIYTITFIAKGLELPSGVEGEITGSYTGTVTTLNAGTDF